jgi:Fe-S-cluster containining protein
MSGEDWCTRCGKCCLNMRPYMTATPSAGGRYHCRCMLSREEFQARVTPADIPRLSDHRMLFRYPKACPFLVRDGEQFTCLIYQDRPGHCRTFRCDTSQGHS